MKKFITVIIDNVFRLSIFLLLCWGAHAWFTWDWDVLSTLNEIILGLLFCTISIIYVINNKIHISIPFAIGVIVIFLLAHLFPSPGVSMPITCTLHILPIIVLLSDINNVEKNLNYVCWILAVLLIPGIIIWALLLTVPMTGIPIQYPGVDDGYLFSNFIFYIDPWVVNGDFPRFFSFFLEPGYLGTLLAFLLFASRFNFKKKYTFIFIVALICSFSLAGYVVAFIGYAFIRISEKKGVRGVVAVLFLGLLIFAFGSLYKDGDNYLNHLIIERLEPDEDVGIAGNDRFMGNTRVTFEQSIASGKIIFGDPKLTIGEGGDVDGAGYMIFLVKAGLLSAFFYFCFYLFLIRHYHIGKYGYYFFFLFFLTFLQAAYPDSYSWLIPLALGITNQRRLLMHL